MALVLCYGETGVFWVTRVVELVRLHGETGVFWVIYIVESVPC